MYKNHVKICGVLTALTPLHLGSGESKQHPDIKTQVAHGKAGEEKPIELSHVQRDGSGKPYIPSTSIKGALRARLAESLRKDLFGQVDDKTNETEASGVMGRLWIYGAAHTSTGPTDNLPHHGKTGLEHSFVAARTRIHRESGTAEDHKLFHTEMAPPGTTFRFHAKWLTNADGEALAAELRDVATALAPLTDDNGVALGRGGRQGQGRVRLADVSAKLAPWDGDEQPLTLPTVTYRPAGAACHLRLTGDGPYITIDSSQSKRGGKRHDADGEENTIKPLMDAKGNPALPGSSLLGALRARTAWLADGNDNPDKVFTTQDDLSPTEQLFGVTGWRGLLEVEKIQVIDPGFRQTFTSVKLDRFSGAPIDGALFSVEAFVDPVFTVTLRLAPRNKAPITDEAQDLFKRLLDDIKTDMGLMLGHGGARGFGWFTVTKTEAVDA